MKKPLNIYIFNLISMWLYEYFKARKKENIK